MRPSADVPPADSPDAGKRYALKAHDAVLGEGRWKDAFTKEISSLAAHLADLWETCEALIKQTIPSSVRF